MLIDPEFAEIKQDYWSAENESFLGIGSRLAEEYGGTFKIRNNKAVLAKRGDGKTPSGHDMPSVTLDCKDNVITLRIKPEVGRSQYKKAKTRYFDRKEAKWKEERSRSKKGKAMSDDDTIEIVSHVGSDKGSSKRKAKGRKAKGRKAKNKRDEGSDSATILLNTSVRVEGVAMVTNAREGIDGSYRIRSVKHRADRNGGAITELTFGEKPSRSNAGQSSKKSGKGKSGSSGGGEIIEVD